MILDLKHGKLNIKLNACNKAMRMAISSMQDMGFDMDSVSPYKMIEFQMEYAYQSYVVQCRLDRKKVEYDIITFEDAIKAPVEESESNLTGVFDTLADTLVSSLQQGVEVAGEKKT